MRDGFLGLSDSQRSGLVAGIGDRVLRDTEVFPTFQF